MAAARRRFLASAVGAVVGHAASARRARADAAGIPEVFWRFHAGLVQVHASLRDGAALIASSLGEAKSVDTRIARFSTELLDHHKSEDAFFFPAFRAAGRARSSDVAFLDARDAEHVDLHRLCLELRDLGAAHARGAVASPRFRIAATKIIGDLATISLPHFAVEEATLTAAHVATLLSPAELVAVYRDMGMNWNRK